MRLVFFALAACGGQLDLPEPVPATCDETDLVTTLSELPNVGAVDEVDCGEYVLGEARCFTLAFKQPIQHAKPDGDKFIQQLFLTHRGCDAPTLVIDSGYAQEFFYDDELSTLFAPNTLGIEHRFQGASTPKVESWDWTSLTIENGAADMHEVISAFRRHYDGRFVSSGASKGGITATYHAFSYPDDLDGSIPYVAPASRAREDAAYQTRMKQVLPSPCAQALRDFQVAMLTTRRTFVVGKLSAQGGSDLDLEYGTSRLDWAFWQYYGQQYCSYVPTSAATDDEHWQFFAGFAGFSAAATELLEYSNAALSYEWLTEHGFAHQINDSVAPLLSDPNLGSLEDGFRAMFPSVNLPAYDGSVTQTVRAWVRDDAENMLLVYGNFDPWSGGAMDEPTKSSSGRVFVPNATHAAEIGKLAGSEKTKALDIASRLFGREPVATSQKRSFATERALADRHNRRDYAIGRSMLRR